VAANGPGAAGGRRAPGTLGALEAAIMDALWNAPGACSVQEVCERLGPGHHYKTVMTVLNRLVEKELLSRELDGRAYRYLPALTRGGFLRDAAAGLVDAYVEAYGPAAADVLAEAVSDAGGAATQAAEPAPERAAQRGVNPVVALLLAALVLETLLLLARGRR
jgi:predicted transcriptional regulator